MLWDRPPEPLACSQDRGTTGREEPGFPRRPVLGPGTNPRSPLTLFKDPTFSFPPNQTPRASWLPCLPGADRFPGTGMSTQPARGRPCSQLGHTCPLTSCHPWQALIPSGLEAGGWAGATHWTAGQTGKRGWWLAVNIRRGLGIKDLKPFPPSLLLCGHRQVPSSVKAWISPSAKWAN